MEDEEFTRAELDQFRAQLHRLRSEVVESLRANGKDPSLQIDTSLVGDDGDHAVLEVEAAYRLRIMDKERSKLADIDRALLKIDEGTFGICEGSGETIERPRLSRFPWVRYSRAWQETLEDPRYRK